MVTDRQPSGLSLISLSRINLSTSNLFPLLPILEVDDVGSLQARLQEVAQFQVLGCRAGLWAAVLNSCRQRLQKQTYISPRIKKENKHAEKHETPVA